MKIVDDKNKKEYFLEWSSIVDAPVTRGMHKDEFIEYYKIQYGLTGLKELEERLKRVEQCGTSLLSDNNTKSDFFFKYNRAGDNEKRLDKEGILNKYCREPTIA